MKGMIDFKSPTKQTKEKTSTKNVKTKLDLLPVDKQDYAK